MVRPFILALVALLAQPAASQPLASPQATATPSTADRQNVSVEEAKLVAANRQPNDFFGISVSLSGGRALVGSSGGNGNQDPVYAFERSGDGWLPSAELRPNDGVPGDRFGEVLALSGDRALVGALGATIGGASGAGAAYVFVRSGGVWMQEAKLTAPSAGSFRFFGSAVAFDGNRAVVTEGGAARVPIGEGAVYVFVRSGSTWALESELTPFDPPNQFGGALAIDGDRVLVGALGDDEDPRNDPFTSGIAYVFVRSGSTWVQEDKLTVPDRRNEDQIAFSVSLSGDTAVLGAPGEFDRADATFDRVGAAHVFMRTGSTWTQGVRLAATDGDAGDAFGQATALSGDGLFIGAPRRGAGTVYAFGRVGSTWTQGDTITPADGADGDAFGGGISLSGTRILIGALGVDGPGQSNLGAAYVIGGLPPVSAEDAPGATASLSAPRPNPSAGAVSLVLTVEAPQAVRAVLIDALGREVRVLVDGEVAGTTTLRTDTSGLALGVYTVRVQGASTTMTRRLTVIR